MVYWFLAMSSAHVLVMGSVGGWIGVEYDWRDGCAYVLEVMPKGPADAGGLQVGDCIVSAANHALSSADDLRTQLRDWRRNAFPVVLRDERKLLIEPRPQTQALEESFCKYLSRRRNKIIVRGSNQAGQSVSTVFRLPSPASVGELRKLTGVVGRAKVIQRACSQEGAPKIVNGATDEFSVGDLGVVVFDSGETARSEPDGHDGGVSPLDFIMKSPETK